MKYYRDSSTGNMVCKPTCVEEWLDAIVEIGMSCNDTESFAVIKENIRNTILCAQEARICLSRGKLYPFN